MKYLIALSAATVIMTGCAAHNVAPPVAPPAPPALPTADMSVNPYRPLPAPIEAPPLPTLHVMVDNMQTMPVQCGEVSVHVGKLDVNMPHGGTIDVAGVKGETKAYHILIEDVTFTHKETCFR